MHRNANHCVSILALQLVTSLGGLASLQQSLATLLPTQDGSILQQRPPNIIVGSAQDAYVHISPLHVGDVSCPQFISKIRLLRWAETALLKSRCTRDIEKYREGLRDKDRVVTLQRGELPIRRFRKRWINRWICTHIDRDREKEKEKCWGDRLTDTCISNKVRQICTKLYISYRYIHTQDAQTTSMQR